jgi:hypothetical protein
VGSYGEGFLLNGEGWSDPFEECWTRLSHIQEDAVDNSSESDFVRVAEQACRKIGLSSTIINNLGSEDALSTFVELNSFEYGRGRDVAVNLYIDDTNELKSLNKKMIRLVETIERELPKQPRSKKEDEE